MSEETKEAIVYNGGLFQYPYMHYDNFKQKEAIQLLYIISGLRLNSEMKFDGYASITFDVDDKKSEHPIFTMLDGFERKNSQALVFDISESYRNTEHHFDKLFLYTMNGKSSASSNYYGFMLYSTEHKDSSNHFWIDKDANDLFLHINQTFNTMMNIPKLKKLRELSDSIQESLNRNKRKARFLSTMAS